MTVSNNTPSEGTPAAAAAPAAATPPAATTGPTDTPTPPATPTSAKQATPAWAQWLTATGSSFYAWLMRPRVRLTITGALLLFIGALVASNSVWTLPLVIVGVLMVAVAWIGHRLEGRFAVEWGEAGTQLAFNATIKAPQPASEAPALRATALAPPAQPSRPALQITSDDVIEGEAHTVEINVAELKALIAAVEAVEGVETADSSETPDAAVRDIRIRRVSDDPARTHRPAG
jgi:hypothetical protein